MPDTLSDIRKGLERRLRELEPFIKEHADVHRALDALGDAGTATRRGAAATGRRATATGRRAGAAVRRTTAQSRTTPTRRGRPAGSGARAQQALKLVHEHPGITISEIAKRMKIKPNYLYRVMPGLEKAGHVKKRDKGYHSNDSDAT